MTNNHLTNAQVRETIAALEAVPTSKVNGVTFSDIAAVLTEALENRKAAAVPVAWTDEEELRDVEKNGCGYLFKVNPITPNADPRRVIKLYAAPHPTPDVRECETCAGTGKIDERLGGYSFSNPEAKCPDCDGSGEYFSAPQVIAEIISKHGDPEAFGERELRPVADIQKMPYNSKLYSMPLKSPKIPAGFILVPTMPTQEMAVAGGDAYVRCEEVNQYPTDAARRIWAAMVAAAPLQEVKRTPVAKDIAMGARLTDHRFKI